MNKSIIKLTSTKKGNKVIHPNNLLRLDDNVIPTTNYFKEKDLYCILMNNDKITNKISYNDKQKYLLTPLLILPSDELLNLYYIKNIDDLINIVHDMIIKNSIYDTINRILNAWIKKNLIDLKKNNKFLDNIYLELFKKYYTEIIDEKIDKKLIKFRKQWFKQKKENEFSFNYGEDLKKYLTK